MRDILRGLQCAHTGAIGLQKKLKVAFKFSPRAKHGGQGKQGSKQAVPEIFREEAAA
jgi:hypothetical protein